MILCFILIVALFVFVGTGKPKPKPKHDGKIVMVMGPDKKMHRAMLLDDEPKKSKKPSWKYQG